MRTTKIQMTISSMGMFDRFRRKNRSAPINPMGLYENAPSLTRNPTAEFCEAKIALTIANLPLSLYVRKKGGGRAPALFSPLFYALQTPTSTMTKTQFTTLWVGDMLKTGNAFLHVLRGSGGNVVGFERIDPTHVSVAYDGNSPTYSVNGDFVSGSDMLHIPYPLAFDGRVGKSPRATYAELIAIDNQLTEYIERYFRNSVGTRLGLELDADWKKDGIAKAYAALAPIMEKFVNGPANAGKPFIAPPGTKVSKIEQSSNAETDLRSLKSAIERQIANGYMVPYELLSGENPYNSLEQRQLAFLSDCIAPLCRHIEESFNRLLAPEDRGTVYAKFDFKTLIATDLKTTIETLDRELKIGLLSLNEARAKIEENSIGEVGDYNFFPANMYPLTMENVQAFFAMSKQAVAETTHSPQGDDKQ